MSQQNVPAENFFSDEVKSECEHIKARGGVLLTPPTL
jgi:hypothetical protein